MADVREQVDQHRDVQLHQPLREALALVAQEVVFRQEQRRKRQRTEQLILCQQRRNTGISVQRLVSIQLIKGPCHLHRQRVGRRAGLVRRVYRGVQERVVQQQPVDMRPFTACVAPQRRRRGNGRAAAEPQQQELPGRHSRQPPLLHGPQQLYQLVNGGGVRMLRRFQVVNADHVDIGSQRQRLAEGIVLQPMAQHHPAAVQLKDQRRAGIVHQMTVQLHRPALQHQRMQRAGLLVPANTVQISLP